MTEGLYYWDYSGAYCALVMLRSYIDETTKAFHHHQWEKVRHLLTQSRFWIGQFVERRTVARNHHGYVAPLPDIPDQILTRGARG